MWQLKYYTGEHILRYTGTRDECWEAMHRAMRALKKFVAFSILKCE